MTVVDIDGRGSLLVHSPIKLSPELKSEIDSLGSVKYVIAPNRWHHLFISNFKSAYPDAKFYCAPGLEVKRKDFRFDGVVDADQKFPWNPYLEHKLVKGVPFFNEVVFYHSPSKTLILTDLAVHICESQSLLTRIVLRTIGSYKKFGWAKLEKLLYIKNKSAFQKSIEDILQWPVEKIVLTHGEPILSDGGTRLKDAFL